MNGPLSGYFAVAAMVLGVLGFQEYHGNTVNSREVIYLALQLLSDFSRYFCSE
jgi:hypothetical protein